MLYSNEEMLTDMVVDNDGLLDTAQNTLNHACDILNLDAGDYYVEMRVVKLETKDE